MSKNVSIDFSASSIERLQRLRRELTEAAGAHCNITAGAHCGDITAESIVGILQPESALANCGKALNED